jgi:hypothetical protein
MIRHNARWLSPLTALLLLAPGLAFAAVDSTATIAGRVVDADSDDPRPFVNVFALPSKHGTMSDSTGAFVLHRVPAGTTRIRALSVGYAPRETTVTLAPGDSTYLVLALSPMLRRMSDATAAQIAIGTEVHVTSGEIECDFVPERATLRVGHAPRFRVRLRNRSRERILLVRSLDGSDAGRSPMVTIALAGPDPGWRNHGVARCGNMNALMPDDFIELAPGDALDPFANGWWPDVILRGCFTVPGRYTATFRYSTMEPDVRQWLGDGRFGNVGAVLSRQFRRTPRVEVTRTIAFTVTN